MGLLPVILAAGMSTRMGGKPKALLEIDKRTLIAHCLNELQKIGVNRALVITGHKSSLVEKACYVSDGFDIDFLFNERYADLNNFYSVYLACKLSRGEHLLIVNCDVYFKPRVLDAIKSLLSADLTIAVDDSTVDDEALGVEISNGRPLRLSKSIPASRAAGEFIGLSVLSGRGQKRYNECVEESLIRGETNLYYEDIYTRMIPSANVEAIRVSARDWMEIDTPEDYAEAQRRFG